MQLRYSLSASMMENELIDSISIKKFPHLGGLDNPTPDETTIFIFAICLSVIHFAVKTLIYLINK